MAVPQAAFEEAPGQFGEPHLFCVNECSSEGRSEVVEVRQEDWTTAADDSPFIAYYKDIAIAAKTAFPEAEYVSVAGHITFAADTSPMKQVFVLLGAAMAGFFAKMFPCTHRNDGDGNPKTAKLPIFGAANVVHADISAEQGAEKMVAGFNKGGPIDYLTSSLKERRVVSANFWRNLRGDAVIKNHHLAVMDAQTIQEDELLATKMKNHAIGGQEQYMMHRMDEKHRLVFFPDMMQNEILVFKQGEYIMRKDSARDEYTFAPAPGLHKNHILHTSIVDPTAPANAVPRRSVVCAAVAVIMKETAVAPEPCQAN
jgi:hypothetical protein